MSFEEKQTDPIPSFAVVIPVVHSLEDLERCLSSIDQLDYPKDRFKVVVVDCHVVHGLKDFFSERMAEYRTPIITLALPHRSAQRQSWLIESALNAARNYARQQIPSQCYVFTVDDCMFEADWLRKIEAALTERVGAVGGSDILSGGLGWFSRAVDCILNSYLGNAGMRRGNGFRAHNYYPRKENMTIPAWVFDRIGQFSEECFFGGEMEFAGRIRQAGIEIKYLPNNPVWHRRVSTLKNFILLKAHIASEKVRVMRQNREFFQSPHFFILLTAVAMTLIGLFSLVSSKALFVLAALTGIYVSALLFSAVSCAVRTRSIPVGLGVIVLMPIHHFVNVCGIVQGVFTRVRPSVHRNR